MKNDNDHHSSLDRWIDQNKQGMHGWVDDDLSLVLMSDSDWMTSVPFDHPPFYSLDSFPPSISPHSFDLPSPDLFSHRSSFDHLSTSSCSPLLNDNPLYLFHQPLTPSLSHDPLSSTPHTLHQLSKAELIERVVRLESERDPQPIPSKPSSLQTISIPPLVTADTKSTGSFLCQWNACDAQAPTLEKLMVHICNHHIGSGKPSYHCEWKDCLRNKKPFMKRHKMHNHIRTHTGERPFVCSVTGCNKTFSRPDSLCTHIKTHSDNRPYLCSMPGCDKAYYHSRSLRKHIKSTHMKHSRPNKHASNQPMPY